MQKFNKTLRGYDPDEVNAFIDNIISKVEIIIKESNKKDEELKKLRQLELINKSLSEKINRYEQTEETLKKSLMMIEKTSEQMKLQTFQERELLINEAKKNANRIVNEALLESETIEKQTENLKRNMILLKRKLKNILETQLELVDEIEVVNI